MRSILLFLLLPFFGNAQKWVAIDNGAPVLDLKQAVMVSMNDRIANDTNAIKSHLIQNLPNLKNGECGLVLVNEVHSTKGHHYRFAQTLNGRPVFRGIVKVNMDLSGRILSLFDHTFSIPSNVSPSFPGHQAYHDGLMIHYRSNGNGQLHHYELNEVYIEEDDQLVPAIHLEVVETTDRYYELVLNTDVKVIYQNDLLAYADPVDSVATLWVFNPDPLTGGNLGYGAPYADSFDQDVLELNAQRIPVQLDVSFDNNIFSLASEHVVIGEFSLPYVQPVTSALPLFNYTRAQSGFEDVNAYYHINVLQNYIRSLGFDNIVDYQIAVDAHALNGSDNSNFNAGFSPPRLHFGEGGVDDAEDADVIVHEYGHAIMQSAAPGTNNGVERKAMDEAVGDYFASSYSRSLSPNRWSDVFTWDGHNEYWPGRSSVSSDHYPEDLNNNLYTDADIWSATLMQIWGDIGREATDAIMIQTAYSFADGMTMPQAALLFLQADTLLFGGSNFTPIRQRMYDRGLIPWNVGIEGVSSTTSSIAVFNTLGFGTGNGALRIVSPTAIQIWLYNALGQEVRSMSSNGGTLNLASSDLQTGVYFLEIVADDEHQTIKLVRN
jgi:hypothetical protein